MKQLHLLFIAFYLFSMTSMFALDIEDVFKSAPRQVLPLLDKNARLDLLDLYNHNMRAEVDNRYNSRTLLLAKSQDSIKLQLTNVSKATLHLIPKDGDTIIRHIHTLESPILQSDTTFYNRNWEKISNVF